MRCYLCNLDCLSNKLFISAESASATASPPASASATAHPPAPLSALTRVGGAAQPRTHEAREAAPCSSASRSLVC